MAVRRSKASKSKPAISLGNPYSSRPYRSRSAPKSGTRLYEDKKVLARGGEGPKRGQTKSGATKMSPTKKIIKPGREKITSRTTVYKTSKGVTKRRGR
jgi:hypothetical protein